MKSFSISKIISENQEFGQKNIIVKKNDFKQRQHIIFPIYVMMNSIVFIQSICWNYILNRMELEASYIIRQLKQLLKHRKYKFLVNRIQKLLEKEEEMECFCMEFHVNLRFLQLEAVNRLFQRNLMKKYKYQLPMIEYLVDLAIRNINFCHHALKEKIKEKLIFSNFGSYHETNRAYNGHNARNVDQTGRNESKQRNNSIRITNCMDTQRMINKFLNKFFTIYNKSVLLINQTFLIYKLDIQDNVLAQYVANINDLKLKNVSGSISQIRVLLFFTKVLFLNSEKFDISRCQEILEGVIEKLLDTMRQINIITSKIIKNKQQEKKQKKYEKEYRQCQKLMVISLVLNNKAKMKLGKETIAIVGIQLFQSYLQGLSAKYHVFRKLMLPELYLQQQFLRYRSQKSQLIQIIAPFFTQKIKNLEQQNKEKQNNKHLLIDFYNNKQAKNSERVSIKPRSILTDINTTKSIINPKHKNNLSIQSKLTRQRSSYDSKNKIITNMIISEIDEINTHYLKYKKIGVNNPKKKENNKSSFFRNSNQGQLKKQALTSKTTRNQSEIISYNSSYQTSRDELLFIQESQYKNSINREKDRLLRRKKEIKLEATENQLQKQDQINIIKDNNTSCLIRANLRYTQEKSVDIDQRDMKKNVVAITSKKKTEIFIEILFQNKDFLGIRKIAEKIESIRKKQQEKSKSMNNRLTSSFNRDQTKHSYMKFEVIAKQILRKHISFSQDKQPAASSSAIQLQTRKKLIQSNFTLGQKSIEAVKEKLQCKINKNQSNVNKYLKNEQIFKLKLKKLGTANFILKKSNEQKDSIELD